MEFVRLEYQNSKVANAELKGHREVILSYAEKGYRYAGFLPVVEGPSGKTLAVDLLSGRWSRTQACLFPVSQAMGSHFPRRP